MGDETEIENAEEETIDDEDDDSTADEETEKTLIKTVEKKGKVFHQCPYPKCDFETERINALHGHIRFRHKTHGQYLTKSGKIIKKDALTFETNETGKKKMKSKKSKSSGKRRTRTVASDSEDDDSIELGKKSEVKGKLRLLLKTIASADPDKRDALMPEREVVMDFIKMLSKATVSEEDIDEIQSRYDDYLLPGVEAVLGTDAVKKSSAPKTPPSFSAKMSNISRMAKLRGVVKQYLSSYAKLPPSKRDELLGERETLVMLNKRLGGSEIPLEELEEMENLFDGEIKPTMDVAIGANKKMPMKDKERGSDLIGMQLDQKREELELSRYDRMLAEERLRHKETMNAMRAGSGGGAGSGTMVPVVRPKMDDNGDIIKDENGNVVMETTYAPAEQGQNMNQLLMTLLLSGKLGGNENNNAVMLAIMDNNTKLLTTMLSNKNEGKSDKEIILEVQNQNLQMMMNMQKNMVEMIQTKKEDPQLMMLREEIRAARENQQQTQNMMHQQQLQYMQREMQELKQYAYRDDLETLEKQKERLERLGIVSSASKDAETKALEESTKLAKEGLDKVDRVASDMKDLVQPFANAQAELMRSQAQQARPLRKAMSEKEKTNAYKQILNNIESQDEAEE